MSGAVLYRIEMYYIGDNVMVGGAGLEEVGCGVNPIDREVDFYSDIFFLLDVDQMVMSNG